MRHLTLWALVLLVLWSVPSCSRTEREHTATIVIAEGGSFLFQTGQNEPVTYEGGDTVLVELNGDTCYVNGQAFWPQPPAAPPIYPAEHLKSRYGRVPFVVAYVSGHSGDEEELWNQAYRGWEEQMGLLLGEVMEQYNVDLQSNKTADEAAETALATLRASPLVSSARINERSRRANSRTRDIWLQWTGLADEHGVMLSPCTSPARRRQPPTPLKKFKDLVSLLRLLEHSSPAAIELQGGTLRVSSGTEAQRTTTE